MLTHYSFTTGDPDNEPDFWEMESAPSIARGSVVEIPTDNSLPMATSVLMESSPGGGNPNGDLSEMHEGNVEEV